MFSWIFKQFETFPTIPEVLLLTFGNPTDCILLDYPENNAVELFQKKFIYILEASTRNLECQLVNYSNSLRVRRRHRHSEQLCEGKKQSDDLGNMYVCYLWISKQPKTFSTNPEGFAHFWKTKIQYSFRFFSTKVRPYSFSKK